MTLPLSHESAVLDGQMNNIKGKKQVFFISFYTEKVICSRRTAYNHNNFEKPKTLATMKEFGAPVPYHGMLNVRSVFAYTIFSKQLTSYCLWQKSYCL